MIVNDYTNTLFLAKSTVRHRNPRHFTEPKPCDYVKANHQHIIDAYAAAGIPEYKEEKNAEPETRQLSNDSDSQSVSEPSSDKHTPNVEQVNHELQSEEKEEEQVIPDDWESLPFFTQRSIARKFDPTVNTKDEVVAVLSKQQ